MSGGNENEYEALRRRNIERHEKLLHALELKQPIGAATAAAHPTQSRRLSRPRASKAATAPPESQERPQRKRKASRTVLESRESEKRQKELDIMPVPRKKTPATGPRSVHRGMGWSRSSGKWEASSKAVGRAASAVAGVGRPTCEDCHLKEPSFGLPDQKNRRWCHQCAQQHEGAVSLKKPRAPCEDCKLKDPSFGMPAERKKRRWCGRCSKQHEGAVYLKLKADTAEAARVLQEHNEGGWGKAGLNSAPAVNTVEEEQDCWHYVCSRGEI